MKADRIVEHLRAGYSAFVVKTSESDRAEKVLTELLLKAKWTSADGSEVSGDYKPQHWDMLDENSNPVGPLNALTEDMYEDTVIFLRNYHWFLDKPNVIQTIQNNVDLWRNKGKAIVVLAPNADVPIEIRKEFMVMDMSLPEEKEIKGSMFHIARSADKNELIEGDNVPIVQAAKGLTKTEIENVLSLSVIMKGKFDPDVINDQKIQTIQKSGLIEVLNADRTYDDLIGYDRAKMVIGKMIQKRSSKGCLFVGPPGCGKTSFMECTVGEHKKIGLVINFGKLFSKWQGEGDRNVDEVVDIICAIGDCVVIMDEFEKQFAGAAGGGGDSGVTQRMTGRWLRFMQEKPEGVYMMGTCNSFRGIPDEYLRPGRWDSSPFYIGMPNEEEKAAILGYYVKKLGIDHPKDNGGIPEMKDWTGAEIEACCQMAKNLECSLNEATGFIIPQNRGGFKEAKELAQFAINASTISIPEVKERKRKLKT